MKKNNLVPNKGLSLSQAQSISNLCYQRAIEIANCLLAVNNYSKTVEIGDKETGNKVTYAIVRGKELPKNVVDLLKEKAELHACQAFLMENIKAKDNMLKETTIATADESAIVYPERPKFVNDDKRLPKVDENFGWEQLTVGELNEYLEAEAFASHIGQFIHSGSILAGLRTELREIPAIEWMEIETGKKSPVMISVHHTAEQLLTVHEELAALHRGYEQRVNYFKAKVKNLTTEENARIAKLNADVQNEAKKTNTDLQNSYDTALKNISEEIKNIRAEFEKTRQARIKEIASMRIEVDSRFQKTVNTFLNELPVSQE
jgi:hypothetical protein